MPDGTSGEGDLMLPLEAKGPDRERPPLVNTCDCLECDCWACNGKGILAGAGRLKCLCYNTDLQIPIDTSVTQRKVVMSCRTFLTYEPNFSPNIKALPIRELFVKVRAHVAAEKTAKEAKRSFKRTPNPGRSDPNGRFHQGQSNAPIVDDPSGAVWTSKRDRRQSFCTMNHGQCVDV